MPYISLGQNKLEAIFFYPRLFLPLEKYLIENPPTIAKNGN